MAEEAYSSDVTLVVTKRNLSTTDLTLPYSMSVSLQFFLHRKKLCEGPRRFRALEALLSSDPSFRPRIDIDLQDEEFDCFPRLVDYVYTGKPIDEAGGCTTAMKKLAGRFGVDISQGRSERVESAEVANSKKRKREEESESAKVDQNKEGTSFNGQAPSGAAAKISKDLSPHSSKDSKNKVKETLADLSLLLQKLKENGGEKQLMERVEKLLDGSTAEQVLAVPGTEWLLLETINDEVLQPLQLEALGLLHKVASHSNLSAEKLGTPQILRHLMSVFFCGHQRSILLILVELTNQTKHLAAEIVNMPAFMDALEESSLDKNKTFVLQILASVADKCPVEFLSMPTAVQTLAADFKWSYYSNQEIDLRTKAIRGMICVLDDQSTARYKRSELQTNLMKQLLYSCHVCQHYEVKLEWSFRGVTTALMHLTEMVQKEALAREMTQITASYNCSLHVSNISKLMHTADNPMREALCLFLALLCDACAVESHRRLLDVAKAIRKQLIRLMGFGSVKLRIRAALALSAFIIHKRLNGSDFEGVGGEFVGALFKVKNLEDGTKWGNEAKRKVPLALQTLATSPDVPLELRNEIGVKLASLVLAEDTE